MSIEDSWVEIKGKLVVFIHEMDTFVAWVARGRAQLQRAVEVITGAGAPPIEVTEPVPLWPAPVDELAWTEGEIPVEAWSMIDRAAWICGLTPEVLAAIMVHESAWFTSKLFREGHNPGGMKYYPTLFAGFRIQIGKYTAKDGNEYSIFKDWQDGFIAMGYFLTQTRYDGIRLTEDPAAEILAIHDAGYAEGAESWLTSVEMLHAKIATIRNGRETWRASDHFSHAEVVRTSHGVQTLPEELKENASWLAVNVLEPIRKAKGTTLSVVSWYRDERINAAVGGEPDSVHRVALAADLGGGRTRELWQAIQESGILANPEVRVLVEDDHYHVAKVRASDPRDAPGGQWLIGTVPLPFEVQP